MPAAAPPSVATVQDLDLLSRAMEASQALSARALLDHLPYGLIATNPAGRVVLANVSARHVLERGNVVTMRGGVVHAATQREDDQAARRAWTRLPGGLVCGLAR